MTLIAVSRKKGKRREFERVREREKINVGTKNNCEDCGVDIDVS